MIIKLLKSVLEAKIFKDSEFKKYKEVNNNRNNSKVLI